MTLNPGSGPLPDATEEQATANMQAFADDLRTECNVHVDSYVRAASSDYGDGRWAFEILTKDERRLTIQMPGAPLETVREGGLRLYVDDDSWVWDFALSQCKPRPWER